MTDFTDDREQQRMQSYINIHLKNEKQTLPIEEQIEELYKKDRNKWIMLAVNVAALLIFGYSFYFDITELSQTVFLIIIAIFGINVGLIFYQKKQLKELVEYLTWKKEREK
ncbi:hypothetical protein SAMN05443144_103168 [Fodinibius roseus]|uniref:Uncharacterized protein n=1 Tax=Fodinibius roseus TaxID=1194090 RepID=A0A1M4WAK7_9BACT|nr:hypothetical protein [Fodinibius roseus]SHE78190.1 hypothetical protein SAMN05443144_103168 [Fodinibius roseus]